MYRPNGIAVVTTGLGAAWGALSNAGAWLYQWVSNGVTTTDWGGLASSITGALSGALSAVQRAGSNAVLIGYIPPHDRAQPLDIEIRVLQLERVEGPLD